MSFQYEYCHEHSREWNTRKEIECTYGAVSGMQYTPKHRYIRGVKLDDLSNTYNMDDWDLCFGLARPWTTRVRFYDKHVLVNPFKNEHSIQMTYRINIKGNPPKKLNNFLQEQWHKWRWVMRVPSEYANDYTLDHVLVFETDEIDISPTKFDLHPCDRSYGVRRW